MPTSCQGVGCAEAASSREAAFCAVHTLHIRQYPYTYGSIKQFVVLVLNAPPWRVCTLHFLCIERHCHVKNPDPVKSKAASTRACYPWRVLLASSLYSAAISALHDNSSGVGTALSRGHSYVVNYLPLGKQHSAIMTACASPCDNLYQPVCIWPAMVRCKAAMVGIAQ